jgi:hypothetical protein
MSRLSRRSLFAAVGVLTLALLGCGTKPTATPAAAGTAVAPMVPPPKAEAKPLIQPAQMTAEDWKAALPRDYPDPLRGGKTDEQLARELELEGFAFEFRGGPIHWWFEVTEDGQNTLPADKPVAKSDNATTAEGRLVVAVGRGASQRMKAVMQKAGKDAFPESVGFQFGVRGYPGGGGGTSGKSYDNNPLWYGWSGEKTVKATASTIEAAKPGDTVTVLTLTCEEPMPADKAKPRKVMLTLKAKFVSTDAPKPEGK